VASHGPEAGSSAGLYEVLGVESSASEDTIRAAITEQRRAWRRRTASPEIEVRHEAERRMKQLNDAERTLLDAASRRAYDEQLRAGGPSTSSPAGDSNWLVKAAQQIESGQHEIAAFTARHAVDADPENPYAWSVLASAASGAGDQQTAMTAITKAIGLDPENAALFFTRGTIYTKAGEHERALASYRAASGLATRNVQYREAVVAALQAQGHLDDAIAEALAFFQRDPDNGDARTMVAAAIERRAEAAHHEMPNGILVIASLQQASYVESLANRGLSVQAPDPMVNDDLSRHRARARAARKRRLSSSALRRKWKYPVGLGLLVIAVLCCISGSFTGGTVQEQMFAVLIALGAVAGWAAVLVATCFEPVHRLNAQMIEHVVPRRSAQGPDDPIASR
jgi:tetratricopeptide (TPR) repeat protein